MLGVFAVHRVFRWLRREHWHTAGRLGAVGTALNVPTVGYALYAATHVVEDGEANLAAFVLAASALTWASALAAGGACARLLQKPWWDVVLAFWAECVLLSLICLPLAVAAWVMLSPRLR